MPWDLARERAQPETSPLAAHGAAGPPASASQGQGQDGRASEFSRRASQIGKSIHSTAKKVSRLASLAKRTGMFDDPAEEINELTAVVKDDIQKLHTALDELQVRLWEARHHLGAHAGG